MHRVLRDTKANIAARQQFVDDALAPLSADRLQWRPSASRWSIIEVLEHLTKTVHAYGPALKRAVERGRARGRTGPAEQPLRTGMVGGFLRNAVMGTKNIRAPKAFRPAPTTDLDREVVLRRFREAHEELATLVEQAAGLDLNRNRMRNPLLPLFSQPIGVTFEVLHLHLNRHFEQIDRLLAAKEAHSQSTSHTG